MSLSRRRRRRKCLTYGDVYGHIHYCHCVASGRRMEGIRKEGRKEAPKKQPAAVVSRRRGRRKTAVIIPEGTSSSRTDRVEQWTDYHENASAT